MYDRTFRGVKLKFLFHSKRHGNEARNKIISGKKFMFQV